MRCGPDSPSREHLSRMFGVRWPVPPSVGSAARAGRCAGPRATQRRRHRRCTGPGEARKRVAGVLEQPAPNPHHRRHAHHGVK